MWLIIIFILLSVTTGRASVTLHENINHFEMESHDVVMTEKESENIHSHVMSKSLNDSSSSIESLNDRLILNGPTLIKSIPLSIRSQPPPPFFVGNLPCFLQNEF